MSTRASTSGKTVLPYLIRPGVLPAAFWNWYPPMKKDICFNLAAQSPDRPLSLRMAGLLRDTAVSHETARKETAQKTAAFFGCADHEADVVFTGSGSEAINGAVRAVMRYGDHAVTTVMEHQAVFTSLYRVTSEASALCQEYSFRTKSGSRPITGFTAAGRNSSGDLNMDELLETIRRKRPRLVITGGGSVVSGDRFEIVRIAGTAHRVGAYMLYDAAYTGGLYPINMINEGIDILCFSGHKNLYGPDGIGGIVYSRKLPDDITEKLRSASVSFGGQEDILPAQTVLRSLQAGEDYVRLSGGNNIRSRAFSMARRFHEGIRDLTSLRIIGNFEDYDRFPIVSFLPSEMTAERFVRRLKKEWGIEAGTAREALSVASDEQTSVYVRFAFSAMRSEEETELAVKAVRALAGRSGEP